MRFTPIDLAGWPRSEHYNHYMNNVPCTYSLTVQLDITAIRDAGLKLYPAMLYCLAREVNRRAEFRLRLDAEGRPGRFDVCHPCYTVFHRDAETFSNIWTEYSPDYAAFEAAYRADLARYGDVRAFSAKPGEPANTFPVSMIPWVEFTGFNLNLQYGFDYLAPIFTLGRYRDEAGRRLIPLAIQVHHAACDGFHASRFVNELQQLASDPAAWK